MLEIMVKGQVAAIQVGKCFEEEKNKTLVVEESMSSVAESKMMMVKGRKVKKNGSRQLKKLTTNSKQIHTTKQQQRNKDTIKSQLWNDHFLLFPLLTHSQTPSEISDFNHFICKCLSLIALIPSVPFHSLCLSFTAYVE